MGKHVFKDVELATDWNPGQGVNMAAPSSSVPACPGVYAEVHWATRGVRIGETGTSLRRKFAHDSAWMAHMHAGTAPPSQLRRLAMRSPHPIVMSAAQDGPSAFEFFVVTRDLRIANDTLRHDVERYLFSWVRQQRTYLDWNRQRSWRARSEASR